MIFPTYIPIWRFRINDSYYSDFLHTKSTHHFRKRSITCVFLLSARFSDLFSYSIFKSVDFGSAIHSIPYTTNRQPEVFRWFSTHFLLPAWFFRPIQVFNIQIHQLFGSADIFSSHRVRIDKFSCRSEVSQVRILSATQNATLRVPVEDSRVMANLGNNNVNDVSGLPTFW